MALELHDHITQQLIAVLFSSQALSDKLSAREGPAKREAEKLRTMLGRIAEEVERISRNLRPSILDQLGLAAVLRATTTEFAARTGLDVALTGGPVTALLPADTELALYRILQEALKNIERHARARHVTVSLSQLGDCVQLLVNDDGIGFDAEDHAARRKGQGRARPGRHARKRAAYVGGTFTVRSGSPAPARRSRCASRCRPAPRRMLPRHEAYVGTVNDYRHTPALRATPLQRARVAACEAR